MCSRCLDLEDRIAWLESELGLRVEAEVVDRIRTAIASGAWGKQSKRNGTSRLIAALYRARGKPMTRWQLMDALPPLSGGEDVRNGNIISVWVTFARKALGEDAIANVWGAGYRLTDVGMDRVREILTPTIIAHERGGER